MGQNLLLRLLAIGPILLAFPVAVPQSLALDTKQVLILNSYGDTTAPYYRLKEVFRTQLQSQFDAPISFNEVNLGAGLDDFDARKDLITELLRNRYADVPPDIVFATGPVAVSFWNENRESVSRQAPLIALVRAGLLVPEDLQPGDFARFTVFSPHDAVDSILRLRPETSHLVVVYGSSPLERATSARWRAALSTYSEQLNVEYTENMTLQELRAKLSGLPEQSAVLYGMFNVDAAGLVLPADSGLLAIRSDSAVPIFGAIDSQLGEGVVGGRMIPIQKIGLQAAAAGVAILSGEPVGNSWKVVDLSVPTYDWRELVRWDIASERLPTGSEIRYRPSSLWDRYAAWIVWVTAVVAVQSLLIISLLVQRRHRHAAELAQAKLSGQLITAHEDERKIIARELHDDLSQRLARLAIDAGVIKQDQNTKTLDEGLENLREELARVSEDVHDMSYRLHPSVVEDLGISTALRTEIQRSQKYADISITERIGETHGQIPNAAALCVYRVVQEALSNAIRHAQADNIEIVFEQDGQILKLQVNDDGRGFDTTRGTPSGGIGLSSMRERVRLLNGILHIRSRPGSGTSVSAEVPLTRDYP
ncbi:MAG: ATP-binding protein [Pseudomonadales bacterium]